MFDVRGKGVPEIPDETITDSKDPDAEDVTVFSEEEEWREFLLALGLDEGDSEDLVQDDGSIVLAIGDRAVTLERHDAVGGIVITALIARTAGPELDGIAHDLLALNGRPQTTGGLIFGVLATTSSSAL